MWAPKFYPSLREPNSLPRACYARLQAELLSLVPMQEVGADPIPEPKFSGRQVKALLVLCAQAVGWYATPWSTRDTKVRELLAGASIIPGDPDHRRCRKCGNTKPTLDFRAAVTESQRTRWGWTTPEIEDATAQLVEQADQMVWAAQDGKAKKALMGAPLPTAADLFVGREKDPRKRRSRRFYYTTICATCRSNKGKRKRRHHSRSEAERKLRAVMAKHTAACVRGIKAHPDPDDTHNIFYEAKLRRLIVARERLTEMVAKGMSVPRRWAHLLSKKEQDGLAELHAQLYVERRPVSLWSMKDDVDDAEPSKALDERTLAPPHPVPPSPAPTMAPAQAAPTGVSGGWEDLED